MARPALALDRLQELADGRFAYRLRHAWADGTETLLFEPVTLIEKLVALGAPPERPPDEVPWGGGPALFVAGRDRSSAGRE